jgi:hypothetical protein
MNTHSEDLVSLDELRSVLSTYAGPCNPSGHPEGHRVRRWRPVLVAAVVMAALIGVGVAIAAGFGAFNGISAANHPQTPADKLDAAMEDMIAQANVALASIPGSKDGQVVASGSRLIGQLSNGANVYVMPTTTDKLCVVVQQTPGSESYSGIECRDPLTQSQPTTMESKLGLAYGVAQDDVASISFETPSGQVTVPVKNNVWSYQGDVDLSTATVHFDDGSTQGVTSP